MLDWLLGGAATLIAALFAWYSGKTAWLERRARRDEESRQAAEAKMVDKALRQLRETQKRYAELPPVRPSWRDDFEKPD